MKRFLIAIGVLLLLGGLSLPLVERVGAHSIVDAPNQHRPAPPLDAKEQRFDVGPPAASIAVRVWEPPSAPRGVIFLLHGIRSNKENLKEWAQILSAAGYRAVAVDSRGHGHSTGDWLSYGVFESRDLSQVLAQLDVPAKLPVGVMGVSYGAATAIEWAGREPRVGACVALAPFSSLRNVVPVYTPRTVPVVGRFMPNALMQATVDAAGKMGGFDPDQASPLAAITLRDEPVLIFHGTADAHIPLSQSQDLQARAPTHTKLVLLDAQDHNHIAHDPRLWPAVLDFFDARLTPRDARTGGNDAVVTGK